MLKEIRKKSNLTQEELSQKANVSLRMIQKYEQGEKDLNKAQGITIYKLSRTLNCKMEDLIRKEDGDQNEKIW